MKRNRGFELLEILIVIGLTFGLATVILASINNARCKTDPTLEEICNNDKEEVTKPATSSIADKFKKLDSMAAETGQPAFKAVETSDYGPVTIQQACGDIPNQEAKNTCEENFTRGMNVQNCIDRYSN